MLIADSNCIAGNSHISFHLCIVTCLQAHPFWRVHPRVTDGQIMGPQVLLPLLALPTLSLQKCCLYPNGDGPMHTSWEIPTGYFSKWTYYLYLRWDCGSTYGELPPRSYLPLWSNKHSSPQTKPCRHSHTSICCIQKDLRTRVRIMSDRNKENGAKRCAKQNLPYTFQIPLLHLSFFSSRLSLWRSYAEETRRGDSNCVWNCTPKSLV